MRKWKLLVAVAGLVVVIAAGATSTSGPLDRPLPWMCTPTLAREQYL
jgi:hypothetical protein